MESKNLRSKEIPAQEQPSSLRLQIEQAHPRLLTAIMHVPHSIINQLYHEASVVQKGQSHIFGFARGHTPLGYVTEAFRTHLAQHLHELLLKHIVLDNLYQQLRDQRIVFSGDPRLSSYDISLTQDATPGARFTFECTLTDNFALHGWKYFPFKPPKRKNYRDLDRAVEYFLKGVETEHTQPVDLHAHVNDWVKFELCIASQKTKEPISSWQPYWIVIGGEEIDTPFRELFLGRAVKEQWYTEAPVLQEFLSSKIDTNYLFNIRIADIVPHSHFSLDDFKSQFRLRTHKDLHKKLIEVFSLRNDLSQRRETIDSAFKLLLSKNPITPPPHVVLRRQESLHVHVQENPDYQVYRMQQGFEKNIQDLAEKQVKEMMLVDYLAARENITATAQDVKQYLNLLKRARTKEFVYFDLPPTRVFGQEMPISDELLKRFCIREKTLNYVIHHLTRN